MKTILVILALLMISLVIHSSEVLTESRRQELIKRIRNGDRDAILETGRTGDSNLIGIVEESIRAQVSPLSNDLVRLEQINRETGWTGGLAMDVELAYRYRDPRIQAAQMALAKLGVRKYLDEIIYELVGTNSPAFRVEQRGSAGMARTAVPDYRSRSKALEKLAYIGDPATVKFIGPCLYETSNPYPRPPEATDAVIARSLASYAAEALGKIVTNGPAIGSIEAWQQWWEQNKQKYP